MADEKILTKIMEKLSELSKKIDDVSSRLSHLEQVQQTNQQQLRINRNIETMSQGQALAAQYETSKLENTWFSSLTPAHVELLRVLASEIDKPISVYQLKDMLKISRTYVHTLLEQLERAGLVRRIPNIEKLSFVDTVEGDTCRDPKKVTPRHLFTINPSFHFPEDITRFIPEMKSFFDQQQSLTHQVIGK